ncbi:hypothetical protein SAMN05444392_1163 [Seinonella peptonophila]|uniref:Uncharacterized protein n=1 Tax=Seinonella peptonophila TaxID=112248 RepID=A0A1M5ATZ8_9BACL|nr:hypothetical protein [Seinonella peptonophila]SHF33748.1 hypothetical protein SAMN05444392_1163 [Seinonella peptonophila]
MQRPKNELPLRQIIFGMLHTIGWYDEAMLFYPMLQIVLMILFIYFTVIIIKERKKIDKAFFNSLLYGLMAVFSGGILSGIWMSSNLGRTAGLEGDILILHFVGFHGLQAIPSIGWLLGQTRISSTNKWVHISGISWLLLLIFLFIQTWIGKSIIDPTIYVLLASFFVLVWFGIFLWSLNKWYQTLDKNNSVVIKNNNKI